MSVKSERQDNFVDICVRCELGCCQGVRPPLSSERRRIIEAFLKSRKMPIENLYVKTGYTFPKEDAEGYCVFFDRKAKTCLVHPVKPETCVAGPVTFDINVPNGRIEWHLKTEKVCQLAAKLYKNGEAFERHLQSAKNELTRLVRELEPEALKAILKIAEPDTFKIGEDRVGEDVLRKLRD